MRNLFFGDTPISVGKNSLRNFEKFLNINFRSSQKVLLLDENTDKHCLPFLKELKSLAGVEVIQIRSGEEYKTIRTIETIWEKLSLLNADRRSVFINLGGGVVCDMGGFAAATYKRGIDFINIPTSLLAQIDASFGGKTGIDFGYGDNILLKNQIGLFCNPKAVFIFPGFLKTLEQREVLSGFAEIIKHALIYDKDYWDLLRSRSIGPDFFIFNNDAERVLVRSIEIKKEIVLEDPREMGRRKILNFGHTMGHAIESFSLGNDKKPLKHGEAVAIGIICESFISNKISNLRISVLKDISSFISGIYRPYKIDKKSFMALFSLMIKDKKNERNEIKFSLISDIGKCVTDQSCPKSLVFESLDFYNSLS